MRKVRVFVIVIIIMMLTSMISLLIVSALTYLFKWQADKAMIGIIVTYILTGFVGGLGFKKIGKRQCGEGVEMRISRKAVEAFLVSNVFVLLLLLLSVFILENPFEISNRFLMIWGLLVSSTFLGRIL